MAMAWRGQNVEGPGDSWAELQRGCPGPWSVHVGGGRGSRVSRAHGRTLETFNTQHGEQTSDPANPSRGAQRTASLATTLNSCLSPLELGFTNTHIIWEQNQQSLVSYRSVFPRMMLIKAWTHITFPPCSHIFPLPHHLLGSKSPTALGPHSLHQTLLQSACSSQAILEGCKQIAADLQTHNYITFVSLGDGTKRTAKDESRELSCFVAGVECNWGRSWRIKASVL